MERWQTVSTVREIWDLSRHGKVIISKQGVTGYPDGEVKVTIEHGSRPSVDPTPWTQVQALLEDQGHVYADVL